jgi:hypothetical protein
MQVPSNEIQQLTRACRNVPAVSWYKEIRFRSSSLLMKGQP